MKLKFEYLNPCIVNSKPLCEYSEHGAGNLRSTYQYLNKHATILNIKCKYLIKYLDKLKYKCDYSITHVSLHKSVRIYLNMNLTIIITKCE